MFEYFMVVWLSLFYVMTGLFVFSSYHKHLLMTLLSLEYIMLNVFFCLIMSMKWEVASSYVLLIFLVFAVSEGSIGLSILVSMIRTHGSDMLKNFSVVW